MYRLPEQHNCPKIACFSTDEYKKRKVTPLLEKEKKIRGKEGKDNKMQVYRFIVSGIKSRL